MALLGQFDPAPEPFVNGFLASVRENHPDLPVIPFTGRGREEAASEASSTGVTDYLQSDG